MTTGESGITAGDEMAGRLSEAGVPALVAGRIAATAPHADLDAVCAAADRVVRSMKDEELRAVLEQIPPPAVLHSDAGTRDAARLALDMYRERFGYPYVSHIDAPTAEELLMRIRIRLGNEPIPEWRASREHVRRFSRARITRALRDTRPQSP